MTAWANMGAAARAWVLAGGAACAGGGLWLAAQGLATKPETAQPETAQREAPAAEPAAAASPSTPEVASAEVGAVASPEQAAPEIAAPEITTWAVTAEGSATIAGLASPEAMVKVLVDGVVVVETKATRGGEFAAITELAPNPAPSLMSLSMVLADGQEIASRQSVALGPIAGPPAPEGEPVAEAQTPPATEPANGPETGPEIAPAAPMALLVSEAGAQVLQGAPVPATGALAAESAALSIETITYTPEGLVQLGGTGQGDALLRLYLDNQPLGELQVAREGRWFTTLAEIAPGVYTLRLDQLDGAGQVTARFETPFKRESLATLAQASLSAPAPLVLPSDAEAESAALQAVPAEAAPDTPPQAVHITVQPGHSLWAIAQGQMGDGMLYVQVFEANRDQIRDPDLIYPGQVFTLPEAN